MFRLPHFVLIAAALFFCVDIVMDFSEFMAGHSDELIHISIEAVIFVMTIITLTYEIIARQRAKKALSESEEQVKELSEDLTEKITQQFEKWGLSPSETEIAWLIVKGFSFSEIAVLRDVREKTVRQQATAVYQKSGVGSRAELTAFFLEDFLSLHAA